MMIRKIISILLIAAVILMPAHYPTHADSGNVLLVYNDKEEMEVISNLIKACGMTPSPVDSVEYSSDMIDDYEYVVLQDAAPFKDVLQSGKSLVCLGDDFKVIPGAQVNVMNRKTHAELNVYQNNQSIILDEGFSYISAYEGETVGNIRFEGIDTPMGVITDKIMFAPYFSKDDITAFAVAKMLNQYFQKFDGGKMYIMIDEVYPFDDISMLELIADKFYDNGIPFVMSIMPVYQNTDYPSFKRYTSALKYIQSKNGSLIMHEPIMTGNELVGDDIDVRMEKAFNTFEENDVHVYEQTLFPYEVSLESLTGIHPQNELFISLPIDTVIKFNVFKDEAELDAALEMINSKWLQIGDYNRNFTDNISVYEDTEVDTAFTYKDKTERSFAFLVDRGNQVLSIVVLISGIIIIALIVFGYRLYREKFLKRGN